MQSIHGNYCRKQNHSLSHEARHAIPVYLCEYDVNQTATMQEPKVLHTHYKIDTYF